MLPIALVNFLIQNGADVRAKDAMGRSLYMVTLSLHDQFFPSTKEELLKIFIEQGVDLNTQDEKGDTALHYVARSNDGYELSLMLPEKQDHAQPNDLLALINAGANPKIENNQKQLPIKSRPIKRKQKFWCRRVALFLNQLHPLG